MAKLERVGYNEVPRDFYETMTHLWILAENGKVYKRKRTDEARIHAEIWGNTEEVWENSQRGYYNEHHGMLSCHGVVSPSLERKLMKKFPTAIKLRD